MLATYFPMLLIVLYAFKCYVQTIPVGLEQCCCSA
uniref:Uncharacterized protein n=1 Tax=Anguilla anguilla TaxID=7936 RepID=A0A0E9US36_ANGAN